jgi:hypothetical protein
MTCRWMEAHAALMRPLDGGQLNYLSRVPLTSESSSNLKIRIVGNAHVRYPKYLVEFLSDALQWHSESLLWFRHTDNPNALSFDNHAV